ncbi:flagellar basal-body MS-ring/collar protein FliF [Paenibacillus sp. J22TS3]|uniref:flagellar basal-body MS-ring/collar protein FliF n=1 Tax=Paenibacillus sp. J22TS3 TaxID=2807192 RepID=UPI001B0B6241|nr:flagellar basal-body MS-ring/collar protein FliF [Paenibacillus sp. J22TS3]GIP21422.1 flagellar M-ring protein [Paenibacillus sp. J22TS3]
MNERIAQYRDKISQYWNHFTKKQKILLISTVSIILLAIILLTMQFSKTQYEVAFTNLDSTDAAGIINYLETSKIPYQLSADGKSISVPSTQAARAKVDVGSQGIVKNGSIGFAGTFGSSSSPIGMTDNEFNVKYKTALNGEVEQLLTNMQGVSGAKVLINLPAENVFASPDEQEKASASVVLSFKPGFRPDQSAVDGYYNLIKTAVPNLPIDNITVTSSDENELLATGKGGKAGSLTGAVQENMQLQKKFENDVRQSVQQFLLKLTGPDKVNVLVASKLNFDQVSQKENLVTPVDTENMKGIEISAQKIQKSYTGQGTPNGGVAGTGQTDVPAYPGTSSSSNTSSDESTSTINYEVNRISKEIVQSPYTVKDLTINVMVEPPAGKNSLDTATRDAIQNVLKNIVASYLADSGITYTDADLIKKVSVFSQAFGTDTATASGLSWSSPIVWGIGAALLLAGAGIGYLIYRRRRANQEEEIEEDVPLAMPTEFPSINLESVTNENHVRKQLETLAKKKPDEFVNLLRTWLADE